MVQWLQQQQQSHKISNEFKNKETNEASNKGTNEVSNKETNEEYDEVMSYEELQKYLTQDNIQQVFKFNMFRYSDGGGMKEGFSIALDWSKK